MAQDWTEQDNEGLQPSHLLRGLVSVLIAGLGLFFGLIALVLVLLSIAPLRNAVLEAGLSAINKGDTKLLIADISGEWPYRLTLRNVSLADAQGAWLTLERAELDWSPSALLKGELHIVSIGMDGVAVLRAPQSNAPAAEDKSLTLPVPPLAVRLDALKLGDVSLSRKLVDPAQEGLLARLNAAGRLYWNRNRLDIGFDANRQDGVAGRMQIAALWDRAQKRFDIHLDGEDGETGKPGLIVELAHLEGADRILMKAEGHNDNGKLAATAQVEGGKALMLNASLDGIWREALDLDIRSKASGDLVARNLSSIGGGNEFAASTHLNWGRSDTLTLSDMMVEAGALTIKGNAQYGTLSSSGSHALQASGNVAGLDRALNKNGNEALKQMDWRVSAAVDQHPGVAHIGEAVFTAPQGAASFVGDASFDGSAKGKILVSMSDARPLGDIIGQTLSGQIDLSIDPFSLQKDGDAEGEISIAARGINLGDETLNNIFGGDFTAYGKLKVAAKGGFALSSLKVVPASGAYSFNANIVAAANGGLSGEAKFDAAEAARIFPDRAKGVLSLNANFSGSLNKPKIILRGQLSNGILLDIPARMATLDVTAEKGGTGPLSFRLDSTDGKISLDTMLGLPEAGGVRLDAIKGNILGGALSGAMAISPERFATGEIKGQGVALKPFSQLAGLELDGEADLLLQANVAGGKQNASLSLQSPQFKTTLLSPIALENLSLKAVLSDLKGAAFVDANIVAASGQGGLTHISKFEASAKGKLSDMALAVNVEGVRESFRQQDFKLALTGRFNSGKSTALSLSNLDIVLGDAKLALEKPATFALQNGVSVSNAVFDISAPSSSKGYLTASFLLRDRSARVNLDLREVPLEFMPLLLPLDDARGKVSGALALDTAKGTGAIGLDFKDVLLADPDAKDQPDFDAHVEGMWRNGRFDVTARSSNSGTLSALRKPFELQASLPVVRDPKSAWPTLATRGKVQGHVSWKGQASSLFALTGIYKQRLAGDASAELTVDGDIANPRSNGVAMIENGTYENYDSGTLLKGMSLRFEGHNAEILAFNLTANDSGRGSVKAEGTVSLAKGADAAVKIGVDLDKARIVRRRDLDLTASGHLDLTGAKIPPTPEAPLTLKGSLMAAPATLLIPDSLPANVAQIEVVEINGAVKEAVGNIAPSLPLLLDLSLKIDSGAPMRIAGHGLDSLWQADITVHGDADKPRLAGTMTRLRGTFDFAGKTFNLTTGNIRFLDRQPIDPELDIALTYQRTDLKAVINVKGPSSLPEITLSSVPDLPRDEIMSRILFNKSAGGLSAFEAAQLASTLAQLSGHGLGGIGILDRLQQSLGLDVLNIGSSTSGATTLNAGKYISQGVYVGVEQGALSSDSSVKVEIDITPQISVQTHIGQNSAGDVGVNWKWDY